MLHRVRLSAVQWLVCTGVCLTLILLIPFGLLKATGERGDLIYLGGGESPDRTMAKGVQ